MIQEKADEVQTALKERQAEATSSETLHDLNQAQQTPTASTANTESDAAPTISPEVPSSSNKQADGSDSGGPM